MRIIIVCLLLLSGTGLCVADEVPKQVTKSFSKPVSVEAEVTTFYLRLTGSNADVQKQVQELTKTSQDDNGGIYHVYDPHVVEWFPTDSNWDVYTGESDMTGRFLVIQNIGYGRGKHAGYDMALVAEFEVTQETRETKLEPKHEHKRPKFVSTKLTIKFLGFRDSNLSPALKH